MPEHDPLTILRQGVDSWNRWRDHTNNAPVSLAGADLSEMALHEVNFLRVDLTGVRLTSAQLPNAHLKDADLTGANLDGANLEHVSARGAVFDQVVARDANFSVATLRGARFVGADLSGARFHRAYLRQAGLEGANLKDAWMRFASFERARCQGTDFSGADLRYASMVRTDLSRAKLAGTYVYGVSAWEVRTDDATEQDLIVTRTSNDDSMPLRVPDLETAQLLSLMLDGDGVRSLLDVTVSKMVLILGSFGAGEKPVLDAMRTALRREGYVAILFDRGRPRDRSYGETVVILAGMSRFVIADFTNAKEIRNEVPKIQSQYKRVPLMPIAQTDSYLPVTMADHFSAEDIGGMLRYADIADLLARLKLELVDPAEAEASRIGEQIAATEEALNGGT